MIRALIREHRIGAQNLDASCRAMRCRGIGYDFVAVRRPPNPAQPDGPQLASPSAVCRLAATLAAEQPPTVRDSWVNPAVQISDPSISLFGAHVL